MFGARVEAGEFGYVEGELRLIFRLVDVGDEEFYDGGFVGWEVDETFCMLLG